jgi:uncharacterized RmlC-like cupin family protein
MANVSSTAAACEGEILYIPAGVPYLPANLSDRPATLVVGRTDLDEQGRLVPQPELEALVDYSSMRSATCGR